MIVNLWSTPRTGSVRYSFELRKQYPGSLLVSEMFNRYHMTMYHKPSESRIHNIHNYEVGAFYKGYEIENGKLVITHLHEPRKRTVEQEESYLIDIFNRVDGSQTLIMHNHVEPINHSIRDRLTKLADENIYIYRKDKRHQLASYAIAYSSKQFVAFNPSAITTNTVADIDINILQNLLSRIVAWDRLEKNGRIIAYEELSFEDDERMPLKQNHDHYSRLSNKMIDAIETLVSHYENNKF